MKSRFSQTILIISVVILQACMPYHSYETSKQSECLFLSTKTFEIMQSCNEGAYKHVTELEVEMKYDTIKIINGQPSDSYTLFKSKHITLPYKLDQSIIDNLNSKMTILIETNIRECSYALRVSNVDLQKEKVFFT